MDLSSKEDEKCPVYIGPLYSCVYCHTNFISEEFLCKHLKKCFHKKIFSIFKSDVKLKKDTEKYLFEKLEQETDSNQTEDRRFQCNFCEKKFNQKSHLKTHLLIRKREKSFECNYWEKKFNRKSNLKTHLLIHRKEKTFECIYCEKKFNLKTKLYTHLLIHTGKKPFECNICVKKFYKTSDLKSHLLFHTTEKPFECNYCEKKFNHKSTLNRHLFHTGEKSFECNYCEKKFNRKSNLKTHLLIHTGEKSYECNYCEKKFNRKSNLKTHLLIHTGEKSFECNYCEMKFNIKSNLKTHLLIHTGEKPFECNYCEKKFNQKSHLKSHLLIHKGEKPFECNYCKKKFNQTSYLKSHLLIHSGEKSYECNYCEKKFNRKSNLKTHLLIHTGEKSYECNYCEKKFNRKSTLKKHLLIHSGEKPFECNYCKKKFNQTSHLYSHLLIHKGEKPFECNYCEKKFNQKSHLKSHLLIHTGEKPFECPSAAGLALRRASYTPLLAVGPSEPLIVVEETGGTDEEDEAGAVGPGSGSGPGGGGDNESQATSPQESPYLNPGLLSPYRDLRKRSLPTPSCTSGITASQVRRLSEHSLDTSQVSREAAFLATLSQTSPAPGGRRHSVVTISRAPPPSTLFGRNRRESIAAFPSQPLSNRVLPGRRESCSGPPPTGSSATSGSSFNLQLDIMDDIAEIKAARKVKLKMWRTQSREQVCEVMDGSGTRYTQPSKDATGNPRRYSDFAAIQSNNPPSIPKRRASEQPSGSRQEAPTNSDFKTILTSLTSSVQEINKEPEDRPGQRSPIPPPIPPRSSNKPPVVISSEGPTAPPATPRVNIEQRRNRLKDNRSNSFDTAIVNKGEGDASKVVDAQVLGSAIQQISISRRASEQVTSTSKSSITTVEPVAAVSNQPVEASQSSWFPKEGQADDDSCDTSLCSTLKDLFVK